MAAINQVPFMSTHPRSVIIGNLPVVKLFGQPFARLMKYELQFPPWSVMILPQTLPGVARSSALL
jgi:hypothetical protein